MKVFIEIALEAFEHIDHPSETCCLQRLTGIHRTPATAANEQHRPRPVALEHSCHLVGKTRIDFPVRPILPGDVLGTHRMADIHVLDLGPAIDEDSLGVGEQKGMSGKRVKMLHGHIAMFDDANIIDCPTSSVN